MKKLIFIFIFTFITLPLFADTYTLDGSKQDMKKVIENVYTSLKKSGLLASGFPRYGKTQVADNYFKLKAISVPDFDGADAIFIDEQRFITFQVQGLNTRPFSGEYIFLLKEPDGFAIEHGMQGIRKNYYIEVNYFYLLHSHLLSQDEFEQGKKIVEFVNQGIINSGAIKEINNMDSLNTYRNPN